MNYDAQPLQLMRRKPDPIRFCHYCRAPLLRVHYRSGRIEKLVHFAKRKYCDQTCYRSDRYRSS